MRIYTFPIDFLGQAQKMLAKLFLLSNPSMVQGEEIACSEACMELPEAFHYLNLSKKGGPHVR